MLMGESFAVDFDNCQGISLEPGNTELVLGVNKKLLKHEIVLLPYRVAVKTSTVTRNC